MEASKGGGRQKKGKTLEIKIKNGENIKGGKAIPESILHCKKKRNSPGARLEKKSLGTGIGETPPRKKREKKDVPGCPPGGKDPGEGD